MSQRGLTWMVAFLLIIGAAIVGVVFVLQGDVPEYVASIGEKGTEDEHFNTPAGVAVNPAGDIFTVDTGNARVQVFDSALKYLRKFGTPGTDAKNDFQGPLRAKFDLQGVLWVADTDNDRLKSYDSRGQFVSEVGSAGQDPGQFSRPGGIAFDSNGNMWVADTGNHRLQKFGPGGHNVLAVIPENAAQGDATNQFDTPWGVCCDSVGGVFVADTQNHRIAHYSRDGTFYGVFGSNGTGPGKFKQPTDVLIDREQNLYVVDSGNNRIQKFSPQFKFICQWGEAGDGPRQFHNPQQIAEAADGTIYIADSGNNRIQKYRPRKLQLFEHNEQLAVPSKPQLRQDAPAQTEETETPAPVSTSTPTASPTPSGRAPRVPLTPPSPKATEKPTDSETNGF